MERQRNDDVLLLVIGLSAYLSPQVVSLVLYSEERRAIARMRASERTNTDGDRCRLRNQRAEVEARQKQELGYATATIPCN